MEEDQTFHLYLRSVVITILVLVLWTSILVLLFLDLRIYKNTQSSKSGWNLLSENMTKHILKSSYRTCDFVIKSLIMDHHPKTSLFSNFIDCNRNTRLSSVSFPYGIRLYGHCEQYTFLWTWYSSLLTLIMVYKNLNIDTLFSDLFISR